MKINNMDYEEKYKEALERARQFFEKPYLEDSAGIVGYIFPELKESKDDRMFDALLEGFKDFGDMYSEWHNGVTIAQLITWLEKQGLKFKVGDLIINKDGNGKVKQILEATNSGYTTNDGFAIREIYEKNYRTCEIKDICQWKPSDEQMFDLKCAADSNSNVLLGQSLLSLYNELKKLGEE